MKKEIAKVMDEGEKRIRNDYIFELWKQGYDIEEVSLKVNCTPTETTEAIFRKLWNHYLGYDRPVDPNGNVD